ncbi:MAG: NYN domain-containing protein [Clostridia bacterium]|nr:NYN domain-containing protein [Clostridia bacterium]
MMFNIFKRQSSLRKPHAIAFVDYEHWYISLEKLHQKKPDIKAWFNEISTKYDVKDIIFFADFSNTAIRLEIPKIREVSSTIIETQNASAHHKKDFTDFIMLDHIYQKAVESHNIDTFIIFSGDGHFSSAVSFLVTRRKKEVIVYGVKDAMSTQLKNCASSSFELPGRDEELYGCFRAILSSLKPLTEKSNKKKGKRSYPTFWATVEAVSRKNKIDKGYVTKAMRKLMEEGYVFQKKAKVSAVKTIKVLDVNWDSVKKDGLFD